MLSVGSKVRVGDYSLTVGQELGQGAFGKVYKAHCNSTGEVALKVIHCENTFRMKEAMKEVETLTKVKHTSILELIAYDKDSQSLMILTEYCSGGTLNNRLARSSSDNLNRKWMRQMATALAYLHQQGITHRDLKPDNVLLADPIDEDMKVADFGLARGYMAMSMSKESGLSEVASLRNHYTQYYMNTGAGTPPYMAPEVWKGHYTEKADVFSLGIIFFAILQRDFITYGDGKRLYGAFVNISGEGKVPLGYAMAVHSQAHSLFRFTLTAQGSGGLQRLTLRALEFKPRDRSDAREIHEKICSMEDNIVLEEVLSQARASQYRCCGVY